MAEAKQVAQGTLFKVDVADDSSFTTVPLVQEIEPPNRELEAIDAVVITEDFQVPEMGMEMPSEVAVSMLWHPGESLHEELDTAFDAKTEFPAQIVSPHGTPVTDEFNVQVKSMVPGPLTPSGMWTRRVVFQRTGDITRT